MSRAIRHGARAFNSLAAAGSFCAVCHSSGARYSAKDGKTLCKAHRAAQRLRVKVEIVRRFYVEYPGGGIYGGPFDSKQEAQACLAAAAPQA
jgi:hypothetical protein